MKNPLLLLSNLLFVLLLNACHRPYALVQRTPSPRFQSPQKSLTISPVERDLSTNNQAATELLTSTDIDEPIAEVALASTVSSPAKYMAQPVSRRIKPLRRTEIESLLRESAKTVTEQPRPKPKPKNQLRLGNRIRESLGLPLRQELNWWQRIDWKLKSSVFVILIAIVFAILGLGQLALIFGLIGALLLVLGLKRSFKKRRPWL